MYGESPPKRRQERKSPPPDEYRPPKPIIEEMIGYGEATQTGVEPQYGPSEIPAPDERPPDPPSDRLIQEEPVWAEREQEPSFEQQVEAAEQEERERQAAKAEQEELKRQAGLEELRQQKELEVLQERERVDELDRKQETRGGLSEGYGGFMDEIAPRHIPKRARMPSQKLEELQFGPTQPIRKLQSDRTPATTDYTTADESQNILDDIIDLGATTATGITPVTEGITIRSELERDYLKGVGGAQIAGVYPGRVDTLQIEESKQTAQRGRFTPTGYAPEFTETVDTRGIHGSSIFPETTEILLGERGSRGPRYTTVKPVDDPDTIGGVYQPRSRKSKDISVSQPEYTTADESQNILSDIAALGATASTGIETSADYMDEGTPQFPWMPTGTNVRTSRQGQVTTTTDRRMRSGGSGGLVNPDDRGVNLIDALVSKTTDDYDTPIRIGLGAGETLATIEEEKQRRAGRQIRIDSSAGVVRAPRTGRPAPQVFDDMGNLIGTTATTPRPPMTTSTGKFKGYSSWSTRDVEGPEMAERRFAEKYVPSRDNWQLGNDPSYQSFMNVLAPSRHGIQSGLWGSGASVGSPDDPLNVNVGSTFWNTTLTTPRGPATSYYRPETDEFKTGSNTWISRDEAQSRWGGGLGNQSMIPGTAFTVWESQLGGLMGGRAQPGRPTELSRAVAPDLITPGSTARGSPVPPPRGVLRGKIDIFGGMLGGTLGPAKDRSKPGMTKKARDLFSGF